MSKADALRIVMVSPGELFGGVETHVTGLCGHLGSIGVRVKPVLFHDREPAARLRSIGLDPAVLRVRHRYDPAAARALMDVIRDESADLVHVHGYRATVTAALIPASRRPPVVKTEHGLPERGGSRLSGWKTRLNHRLEVRAMRRVRAEVCYVTSDVRAFNDAYHAGLPRTVIYNGIDPLSRERRPRPGGLDRGAFNVGIVGRVSAVKGIETAIRAIAMDVVPSEVRVHVLGTGPLVEPIRRLAAALGIEPRVRLHGFQRNILDWMSHLDAIAMPSVHEGLPYTLLEAMSLGMPIVASRVGGLAEVLEDGVTALLVDVGDTEGLAASFSRLAVDRRLGERLGATAAVDQRSRFTLQRMALEYVEIYRRSIHGCTDAVPA